MYFQNLKVNTWKTVENTILLEIKILGLNTFFKVTLETNRKSENNLKAKKSEMTLKKKMG